MGRQIRGRSLPWHGRGLGFKSRPVHLIFLILLINTTLFYLFLLFSTLFYFFIPFSTLSKIAFWIYSYFANRAYQKFPLKMSFLLSARAPYIFFIQQILYISWLLGSKALRDIKFTKFRLLNFNQNLIFAGVCCGTKINQSIY